MDRNTTADRIINEIKLRAKELNCLYSIEEILRDYEKPLKETFSELVLKIPRGWQYPDFCCAVINAGGKEYKTGGFTETEWCLSADIKRDEKQCGFIKVYYTRSFQDADEGPFTADERKLINKISDKIEQYLLHRNLLKLFYDYKGIENAITQGEEKKDWKIIIDLLKFTDENLYYLMSRKMLNHLVWSGIKEAAELIKNAEYKDVLPIEGIDKDPAPEFNIKMLGGEVFRVASEYLGEEEILNKFEKWLQEERASVLLNILEDSGSTINDVADILRRNTNYLSPESLMAPELDKSIRVSLTRKLLSENLQFIDVAKNYITVQDFQELLDDLMFPKNSHGKIGGKGAGLFLASKILKKENPELHSAIKFPKTKYILSDGVMSFIHYNNLEEVFEHKYRNLDFIHQEYPYIVQLFKDSSFPPDITEQLSEMLDEFGNTPLAIRSSALLEDDIGTEFSGKYRSIFIANQGPKHKRLKELTGAIAEVYASIFSSEPLKYRAERGLLDYNEQMGIIIQEISGVKACNYFLPSFSGVAFSINEFKWSPDITPADGLVKLIPGLGIKFSPDAKSDNAVLISAMNPSNRIYKDYKDIVRYSPKTISILDLNEGVFKTIAVSEFLKKCGNDYPCAENVFSVYENGCLLKSSMINYTKGYKNAVVTFDGLIMTPVISNLSSVLKVLAKSLKYPVEIEFAYDGNSIYLLQSKTQSVHKSKTPVQIPQDIDRDKIIFTTSRNVSDARMPDLTHIVYIDPLTYFGEKNDKIINDVKSAISKLNKVLPKKQFGLAAGGRWGCSEFYKSGINVDFEDINNTAVLIEIEKKTGIGNPVLSFGKHFFADLIRENIPYVPVYPDDKDAIFNEMFLGWSVNLLGEILPKFAHLESIVKVTDVISRSEGRIIKIFLNSETQECLAYLSPVSRKETKTYQTATGNYGSDDHWRWRLRAAETIAAETGADKFGIKDIYLFGSTKNGTAESDSDINLIIHHDGAPEKRKLLEIWLEAWGKCLSEFNYLKTGITVEKMIDAVFITEADFKNGNSYAMKIDASADRARKLEKGNKN